MERNRERSVEGKLQYEICTVQEKLRHWYRKGPMRIVEIIKPDNNNRKIIKIITTAAAPANATSMNATQKIENNKLPTRSSMNYWKNILEHRYLIKVPNEKIQKRELANDLGKLSQGFVLITPK